MITLFTFPQTRGMRAIWMLEEAGCEYRIEPIDIRDASAKSHPAFAAASPLGKVPAIVDGDVAMAESAAICLYLADRYRDAKLSPAVDSSERGEFLFWLMYTPAVMEPCMAEAFGTAKANRVSHGWADFDSMIDVLTARLTDRTWVMGEDFSAADVLLGSSVNFLHMFGIMPENTAVLADYLKRCAARPAFQAAAAASLPPSD